MCSNLPQTCPIPKISHQTDQQRPILQQLLDRSQKLTSVMNDPPMEECRDAEPLARTVSASSMQSPTDRKVVSNSDLDDATESSSNTSSPSSFAQTRSPPPIVDTEHASKQSSPSDQKSGSTSPTPDTSPFSQGFSLANARTSFFSTRRVPPILRLKTISQKTKQVKNVAPKSTKLKLENTAIGDITSNGLGKALAAFQESTQADADQEKDTIAQEITLTEPTEKSVEEAHQENAAQDEMSNMNETATETVTVSDAMTKADILDCLAGLVDQQLAIEGELSTGMTDADPFVSWSCPAPFIPPFEEPKSPQTSWGISTWKAIEKPQPAATYSDQLNPHPLSVEITRSPSAEKHAEKHNNEKPAIALHEADVSNSQNGSDPVIAIDSKQHEVNSAAAKQHDLADPNSVNPQKSDDQSPSYNVPRMPEKITRSPAESPDLLDPPNTSDQVVSRTDYESTSVQPNIWVPEDWPLDLYHQDHSTTERPVSMDTPKKTLLNSLSSTPTCHKKSAKSESPTAILSSPTNASDTGLGMRLSNIMDNADVFKNDQPERTPTEMDIPLNQQLHDFKADFLREFNAVLSESVSKWNTARNSIAATIIARPSINEALNLLGASIKVEIADKQSELLNKIDATTAESLSQVANTTKMIKRYQRALDEKLKSVTNTINAHINQRFDELEDNKVTSIPLPQDELVEKNVQIGIPVTDKDGNQPDIEDLLAITEQMKSLVITSVEKISDKLDRSRDHARVEQNENVAAVASMQRDINFNLQAILRQSTLQNQAINHLATFIAPLTDLIKGISHDTTYIDAKLAKNASILTTVTEQVDKLDRTASSFDKIISNAAIASRLENEKVVEKLEAQITKIAGTANSTTEIATKVEDLQDQIKGMEQRLSQVIELLAKRSETENAASSNRNALSHRTANERRGSESGYSSAAQSSSSELPDDSIEPPTISVRTTFIHGNQKRPDLKVSSLPHLQFSDLKSIMNIITKTRLLWTKYLVGQGVFDAEIELLSIKVPATEVGDRRRLIDNQTAYDGWYKAATNGYLAESRPLLEIEFLVREKDGGVDEPKTKKRKHDQMRRDSSTLR